jgi:peptidoglycan hydrolase-like protein with peptidoglycan-binding domain
MSAPNAVFVRPLYGPHTPHHSAPGEDVVAVKRALSRAGYLPWSPPFTENYDQSTVDAVKKFQIDHGIWGTGNYGHATHDALRRTKRKGSQEWAFDLYSLQLLRKAASTKSPEQTARDAIEAACAYWIRVRDQIAYSQARPFPVLKPPAIPSRTDCSGFATTVWYAAGCPNPNGRAYDGLGYTGTLIGQGVHLGSGHAALAKATPGCLVFYGFTSPGRASPAFPVGSPTHVAVALSGGYVAGHGGQSGPLKLVADYRSDIHSVRQYALR